MVRQLSPRSSADALRQEAKRWLKALRNADAESHRRLLAAWPAAPAIPTLRDVQHALAREFGMADWVGLLGALEDLSLDRQSHVERVEAVLRHGWDGDRALARRIIARYPEVRRDSLLTAAACGDVGEVRRRLAQDPAQVGGIGGSMQWTALAALAYSRLDAEHAVTITRLLLDAGADPNFQFDDGWGSPFRIVTGVIGLGEGVKHIHPQAFELLELLIASGADPYDVQALYNTSIADDDVTWTALLWSHCERQGRTAIWHQLDGPVLGGPIKVGTLNYLLGNAVGQNHLHRAAWLLDHGADASTVHAYSGQSVHTLARLSGFRDMAALLRRHGATEESLRGERAFHAALMEGDEETVRQAAALDPSLVRCAAPLLAVAAHGQARAAALLLELGADVNAPDHEGITPLHRAVQAGSLATIEVLLEAGADVDRRERKWQGTPMSWACVLNQPHAAERLAPISRDVRALASTARTTRLAAVLRDEPTLANHSLSAHDAPTPLFCLPDEDADAAAVARVLLAFGADPGMVSRTGRTAEQLARFRGLDEAADVIAEHGREVSTPPAPTGARDQPTGIDSR